MSDLKERYEAVHAAIMEGPNSGLQGLIDSGLAWTLEGALGRSAKRALDSGACVLAAEPQHDYYGSLVPSYEMVKDIPGSPGSVANAESFLEGAE